MAAKGFGKINLSEKLDQLKTSKANESKETKHKKNKAKETVDSGENPSEISKSSKSNNGSSKLTDSLDVIKQRVMANATEEMVLAWKYQPIHVASALNLIDEMKLLFAFGGTVDQLDANECTALHRAAENGSVLACEMLIQHKANVDARDVDQMTPLMYAALGWFLLDQFSQ